MSTHYHALCLDCMKAGETDWLVGSSDKAIVDQWADEHQARLGHEIEFTDVTTGHQP